MKERVFFEEFDSLYYFHGSTQNWGMQGFHFHKQYEVILFMADGAMLEVGNRVYHVEMGDMFILNNKEYHRTIGAIGQAHNRYVLMFDPSLLFQMTEVFDYDFAMFFENRSDNFIHKIHLSTGNLKKMEELFSIVEKSISEEQTSESLIKKKLAILQLVISINEMYTFFMEEQKKLNVPIEKKTDTDKAVEFKPPILYRERIEQIKKYVTAHVEEKLELEDVAKKFYMSKYYLSHYFKKETGFTLLQYITNQKLAAAKGLLKSGMSVTEVALYLSYNSDSHFISVFKKSMGITPKKYAQEKQGKNGNNV